MKAYPRRVILCRMTSKRQENGGVSETLGAFTACELDEF